MYFRKLLGKFGIAICLLLLTKCYNYESNKKICPNVSTNFLNVFFYKSIKPLKSLKFNPQTDTFFLLHSFT